MRYDLGCSIAVTMWRVTAAVYLFNTASLIPTCTVHSLQPAGAGRMKCADISATLGGVFFDAFALLQFWSHDGFCRIPKFTNWCWFRMECFIANFRICFTGRRRSGKLFHQRCFFLVFISSFHPPSMLPLCSVSLWACYLLCSAANVILGWKEPIAVLFQLCFWVETNFLGWAGRFEFWRCVGATDYFAWYSTLSAPVWKLLPG